MPLVVERLTFGWWNTGLSPAGKSRASEHDLLIAVEIIENLLLQERVECLGLGEVAKSDLDLILDRLATPGYICYEGTFRYGRAQFDTAAIFNGARLNQLDQQTIFERRGDRALKLANRVSFTMNGDAVPFHVFISHWPSHLIPDSESLRVTLGVRLGSIIQDLIRHEPEPRVIVMGDFNEEPFHECLEAHLLATRDRSYAIRSTSYLYNPFWRHLGEAEPYTFTGPVRSFAGTCYVSAGTTTKWKTVDQIIFSSAFLGRSAWHLNEQLVKILHITPKATGTKLGTGIFDHFPVVATIEKVVENMGEGHA